MKKIGILCLLALLCVSIAVTGCSNLSDVPDAAADSESKQTKPAETSEITEEAGDADNEPSSGSITEVVPEEAVPPASDEDTKIVEITCPEFMDMILSICGTTTEHLSDIGCRQLITVKSSGTSAQIRLFLFSDNKWTENEKLGCDGYVGSSGVSDEKQEGDGATPAGLYRIGEAFYIDDEPDTGLDIFEITSDTYWVDDPDSSFYNQRVEGDDDADWNSAEHMIDYYQQYNYGCVVEYNTEAIYGAGSAIFFHIGYGPTTGCIAVDEQIVKDYLSVLDKTAEPHIVII